MDTSFFTALTVGFLGGVHCLGMCGGIVAAINVGNSSQHSRLTLNIFYNIGRISSYIIAGLIAGSIGLLVIKTTGGNIALTGLKIAAAFMLIALGLYLSGLLNVLKFTESLGAKLWQYIAPWAKKFYPFHTISHALIAGLLWGWIPCGMVYSVLAWAVSAGTPLNGAWIMLGFGLGTLPNLLAMGMVVQKIKPLLSKAKLFSGLLIVAFGLFQLFNIFTHSMPMHH